MMARVPILLLLSASCCWGKGETAVTARLKAEFKEAYHHVRPAAEGGIPDSGDEPVFKLDPMIISGSFEKDILAEARRAAAVREAAKFSLLKGGTLFSSWRGDVGFWPGIVPVDATPGIKKGDVALRVDLLRLKW